jgi:hypothetical protein
MTKSKRNQNISAKDIVQNYGSVYTTSGGSRQVGGVSVRKFIKKIADNRLLDIYLKYMGVKTLTVSTLVPLGLIMGQEHLAGAINFIINSDQKGGNFLDNKIPVLDDELIGNYLKISGLSLINLDPATLVPLGILMVLYNMYESTQTGGRVVLPPKYFNDAKVESYSDASNHSGNSFPNTDMGPKQTGGRRLITGNSIPPNAIQDVDQLTKGQSISHHPLRPITYYNDDMQLACKSGNCGSNIYHSKGVFKPKTVDVKGVKRGTDTQATWSFGPGGFSQAAASEMSNASATLDKMLPGFERHPVGTNLESIVSPSMAGGAKKKRKSKDKKSNGKKSKGKKKGGGSDWLSSHNSRGAVNSPGMNEQQFRTFTSTADYISNKTLSKGAADHFKPSCNSNHITIYDSTPHQGVVSGANIDKYGGSKRKGLRKKR